MARWTRLAIAVGATVAVFAGSKVALVVVKKDLEDLVAKYPVAAADASIDEFIANIPVAGGLWKLFGSQAAHEVVRNTMTEEDQARFDRDSLIVDVAPWVGLAAVLVGVPVSLYLLYRDVLAGPPIREVAGTAMSVVPLPAAQVVAPQLAAPSPQATSPAVVAASPLPAEGNPTTFERGTKARAVRDVLARHISRGGGAREPYAVATAVVKEKGPVAASAGLPPKEVKAELKEQTEAAKHGG